MFHTTAAGKFLADCTDQLLGRPMCCTRVAEMEQATGIKSQLKGEGRRMPALQPCAELPVTLVLQIYPWPN